MQLLFVFTLSRQQVQSAQSKWMKQENQKKNNHMHNKYVNKRFQIKVISLFCIDLIIVKSSPKNVSFVRYLIRGYEMHTWPGQHIPTWKIVTWISFTFIREFCFQFFSFFFTTAHIRMPNNPKWLWTTVVADDDVTAATVIIVSLTLTMSLCVSV